MMEKEINKKIEIEIPQKSINWLDGLKSTKNIIENLIRSAKYSSKNISCLIDEERCNLLQ